MKCENFLCIYELNGQCAIGEIELDIVGQRTACKYPNFDNNYLKSAKQELLEKLSNK